MIGNLVFIGNRLAGQDDPRLARGLALAVLESVATAVPYAAVLIFVNAALEAQLDAIRIAWLSLAVLGSVLLRMVLSQAAMSNLFLATHDLMGRTRIRVADHLRTLPMGFFTARRSGDLTGVLTTDIGLVEDLWSHLLGVFASSFLVPLVVAAGLCLVDPRLGAALALSLPMALAALWVATPLLTREMDETLDAARDTNARIVEVVQGIAVLRAFGRHGDGQQRLEQSMRRLRDALIRTEVYVAPVLSVFGFVVELSFVVVALLGSYLLLGGSLEPRALVVVLVVAVGVTHKLSEVGVAMLSLRMAQKALLRIEALLGERPLEEAAAPAAVPTRFDVRFEGVSFAYEGDAVLTDVSTAFGEGQLTAIVGASGSGKSTLVHLIARLWEVPREAGSIRIGGVDIRDLPLETLHRHIAMVFQDVVLFSGSVLDNLRVGDPEASLEQVMAAAKAAQAHDFVMAMPNGYDTVLGEGGGSLSGGERQRLSIARAILKNAPIVLLDEATASVDASAEAQIQRAIDALTRDKTVVVIAHRLRTVARAHAIVVLDGGRVVETGTHVALLSRDGAYARAWREQERARGWTLAQAES